jgi:hypothetical protein
MRRYVSTTYPCKEELLTRQDESDAQELKRALAIPGPVHRALSAIDQTTGPIILTEHERVLLRRVLSGVLGSQEAATPTLELASVMALRADVINNDVDPPVPNGLCSDRSDHQPHIQKGSNIGPFWCTADQSQREPFKSERRRSGAVVR